MADTRRLQHIATATWIGEELAAGAKIYYKGWLADRRRPEQHWIVGAEGAREAFASGQIEVLDIPTVLERTGGGGEGLLRLLTQEVERALDEGWPRVAMSQESPHLPITDEDETTKFAAQERGFELMAERWPLHALCQLTVEEENEAAVWVSAGAHHREIVDGRWSATMLEERWRPRGELEAHVARRFGAALRGALDHARRSFHGADLHIDFSAVDFMDVACAQVLAVVARGVPRHQRVIIHNASTFVRHLVDIVGRPPTVLFDHEADAP